MAKKRAPEKPNGSYLALPHAVADSVAFVGLSDTAKSLLFALLRQHNGRNNGRLHLTQAWLAKHGWRSADMNRRARDELIERQLILRTRLGGLNAGPDWFALTWLDISDFIGLDMARHQYHPGRWHSCDLPPTARRKPPSRTAPEKRERRADHRRSAEPTTGAVENSTGPTTGAETALFAPFTAPVTGNNVFTNTRTGDSSKRIVGRAGRSGKKSSTPPIHEIQRDTPAPSHDDGTATRTPESDCQRIHEDGQPAGFWDSDLGEFRQPPPRQSATRL